MLRSRPVSARVTAVGFTVVCALAAGCREPEPRYDEPPPPVAVDDPLTPWIEAVLRDGGPFDDTRGEAILRFYRDRAFEPVWHGPLGMTTGGTEALVKLFRASEHGLRADDYVAAFSEEPPASARERAARDVELSASVLRYIQDLHEGRVKPSRVGQGFEVTHRHLDLAEELRAIASAASPADAMERFAPRYPQYRRLKRALRTYRSLENLPAGRLEGESLPIRPGDVMDAIEILEQRLLLTGDLLEQTPREEPVYAGDLVEAVRRFQFRHGLNDDGVIGERTLVALNTPFSHRVEQLIASMERWRWVDEHFDGTPIIVNIPEFKLRAMETHGEDHHASFESRVIVGRYYERFRTPIFSGKLDYMDFWPYWNVPASIIRNELSPHLDDPGYFAANRYEIVADSSLDAVPLPVTPENVARVRSGALRLRQRPGPANALGLVKFMFPNPHSVFLHSTPSPQLFQREERAFSHGCIRVADPRGLAEWVLAGQDGVGPGFVAQAFAAGKTTRVPVQRNVPVYIMYFTAFVDPRTDDVHFGRDIYGLDAELFAALGLGDGLTSAERDPYRGE